MNPELLTKAKSLGFSDRQIAHLTGQTEDAVRAERKRLGLVPSYRLVDTCAAEFEAYTPYYYSTYDRGDDEIRDKLFFEPLTLEDVLHIYERQKCWGAIAQFGGQTPLNLALGLQKNGVNIIGTSP